MVCFCSTHQQFLISLFLLFIPLASTNRKLSASFSALNLKFTQADGLTVSEWEAVGALGSSWEGALQA